MDSSYFEDLQFVNYADMKDTGLRMRDRYYDGYYGLQFHYEGKVDVHVNDNPLEVVDSPHVFITYPGARFNYGAAPGSVRSQAHVSFRGERVKRYLDTKLLRLREQSLFTPIYDPERFLQSMHTLFALLRIPGKEAHARAVLQLEALFLQLEEQHFLPKSGYSLHGEKLRRLTQKIAASPEKNWDFAEEAKHMALSYVHFRRLFQQFAGSSPGQYLLECRLLLAEKLLTNGEKRILEISDLCGFDNESHFSRLFKKHRALSPSAFRKRYGFDS